MGLFRRKKKEIGPLNEIIWSRICEHQLERFEFPTGPNFCLAFGYKINSEEHVILGSVNKDNDKFDFEYSAERGVMPSFTKSEIEEFLGKIPPMIDTRYETGKFTAGILYDKRICKGYWKAIH